MQQAHHIAQASDLDQQRAAFQSLSDRLILLEEKVGSEQLVYKQYCPMADQDKGAYWLSEDEAVRNPYVGESMLKCGEVVETYQKTACFISFNIFLVLKNFVISLNFSNKQFIILPISANKS